MDVGFFLKPQNSFSSSIPPLSSPILPSHFHPKTSLRREFLGFGIRFISSSSPTRRRRRSRFHARSSPFLIQASIYGRSLLVAVAVAVANFAAIRLFYLYYIRLKKKDASKLSSPNGPDVLAFSERDVVAKKISVENQIEDPGNPYKETTLEERKHIFEDSENGHVVDVKKDLLKSHLSALKCEGDVADKLSREPVKEVLSSFSNDGFAQTEEDMGHILSPGMINEVDALEPESFVVDMPQLFSRGGIEETEIRPKVRDVRSEHALKEESTKIVEGGELSDELVVGELQVSSFNGLSRYVREDIYSFYEEKQSGLRNLSRFEGASAISPHTRLQENTSISPLLTPQRLKGAEESLKNLLDATEYFKERVPVAFYKDLSASKRGDSVKPGGLSRDRGLKHQTVSRDMHRSLQPNGIIANGKSDPSEYLSTYSRLLRAGRLTDCIELLQSMERKGLLDMDKVYHARFFKACRSKKAVKEAFCFTKLIKNPTLSTFNMLLSVCATSQDSEGPFEVRRLVKEAGLKADCKLYTTLISTCAKNGKVDTMFEVFHEMVNAGVEPNVHTYGALIDGCGRAGQVAKAFGAYGIMRSKKVKPDRVIFNALITACGQSGAVDRAFDVLAEMRAEAQPIDPDHVTIGALIKTCTQAGQVDRACEVYKMIHQYNIKGTPEVYTIAVNSCSQVGDLEFALSVYGDMKRNGVVPDEMFFSALIDVAGHAGKADVAFEVLQDAKSQGIRLGNISYSSLMGACSKAKNWQKALELYEDLKVIKLLLTVSTLNALMTSLCDGDQLYKAVDILAEMKKAGVCPNDITYSVLLMACEKNDELELGFELFSQAKKDGVFPNLIMCKCLTGLCLQRFLKAASIGEPVLSFNSGKPQIDNKWTSWALMFYRETIAAGVLPSVEVVSQVLGCLQFPHDTSLRNRLVENLGVSSNSSRRANLYSFIDGFGEYDPRSFSLLEEAASLGIIQCVSFKQSPIIVDARKLQIHTAEVYLLTILKGLKHRLAAGARLPNINILLPVEKTQIISHKGDKTVHLAGRVGQAVGAMLRRLGLRYQGKESLGKIRISGLALKRWFQPKLTKLASQFGGKPAELGTSPTHLRKEITNQQRDIRTSNLSLE